jgi:8-oxo-dGTP diphosphatase
MITAAPSRIAVQLRAPEASAEVHEAAARALMPSARAHQVPLLVSAHVALAAHLDIGVHLPESGPDLEEVRAIHRGPIGASCHDAAGLVRRRGADFAVLGPVAQVPGKGPPLSWDTFATLARAAPMPVYALGGIAGPDDVRAARAHGARGVAVMRVVSGADAVDRLRALLDA